MGMSLLALRPGLARRIVCPRCSLPWPPSRALSDSIQLRSAEAGTPRANRSQGAAGEKLQRTGSQKGSRAPDKAPAALSGLRGLRKQSRPTAGGESRAILGQSADLPIRARFAPSPTGYLHVGSLRTALFNNLAAIASKEGAFIIRIEDTDQSRLVGDAEERLLKSLKWAGLSWHEGPDCGGPHGPYRQSERLDVYKEHVHKLLDDGHAYRCFCSPEQLDAQKRRLHDAGQPTLYPGTCRSVPRAESDRRAAAGESYTVRFRSDPAARPQFRDAIYGPFQKKDAEEDFILLKTDGFPTYHFANVVDDHLMEITHVIRGEEWLISTPKHLALYEAFGWQPPTFAHLALLINPDGTKLSKRHASADLDNYRHDGVLPIPLLTWLANLGSSFAPKAKTPRSIDDIASNLTFKFTRGGIRLNPEKLDHFQGNYRQALLRAPLPSLAEREAALIDKHILQPMLRDIDATTRAAADPPSPAWPHPLEPVPAMLSDPASRAAYLRAIWASEPGTASPSSADLLRRHPYLFWRPPVPLYRASLAARPPDSRVIAALRAALANPALWAAGRGGEVAGSITEGLGAQVGAAALHGALRLVAVGAPDVDSMNSARLFALLGREEWAHRLGVVERLLGELQPGTP